MTFNRALLDQTFPGQHRLVAQFEELDTLLDDAQARVDAIKGDLQTLDEEVAGQEDRFQPKTLVLSSILEQNGKAGALEFVATDQINIRPIDGEDAASLASRGATVIRAGRGTTAERPVVPDGLVAIYFDTTITADGHPVLWDGTKWLDGLSARTAAAQADSTAVDVAGIVADFNALLAKLRSAGLMSP